MLSGTDLRQALQAGLWEALADDSDRAAMRATCRDAREMADALHATAVLPVGPDTWDTGAAIAAYHRRLVAVRSVHVVYSGGAEGEARALNFIEAYSAALGATLPAADCSIAMPYGRQLPAALAAALLQRVVPHVERLDMALGSYYDILGELMQALEPCARLCSLRLLPTPAAEGPDLQDRSVEISFRNHLGALLALCRLPRLHTLSGPWVVGASELQHLCDALPSLTTLGVRYLSLRGACLSRRLHTLASWDDSAGRGSVRLDRPWHLQRGTCSIDPACSLQTVLPAVRNLDAVVLDTHGPREEELPAIQESMLRFAACADSWAYEVTAWQSKDLQVLRGMPPGSFAPLRHLIVHAHDPDLAPCHAPAEVASAVGGLVSAAPNMTTLAFYVRSECSSSAEALMAVVQPLRRAARLRTLWLNSGALRFTAAVQAALLEGVVRCLAQPGAEGGAEYCRVLQHVLLHEAQPNALATCRAALARDGICVSVGTCDM